MKEIHLDRPAVELLGLLNAAPFDHFLLSISLASRQHMTNLTVRSSSDILGVATARDIAGRLLT